MSRQTCRGTSKPRGPWRELRVGQFSPPIIWTVAVAACSSALQALPTKATKHPSRPVALLISQQESNEPAAQVLATTRAVGDASLPAIPQCPRQQFLAIAAWDVAQQNLPVVFASNHNAVGTTREAKPVCHQTSCKTTRQLHRLRRQFAAP